MPSFTSTPEYLTPRNGITISGDLTLARPLTLDGLLPERVPSNLSMKMVAALPRGRVEPLLWPYQYKESDRHPFLFRKPLDLPAGTVIRGVPPGSRWPAAERSYVSRSVREMVSRNILAPGLTCWQRATT
jgi:hypothetical protein